MADYKYIGLTTYIKENEENMEKLSVLEEAIDYLQFQIKAISYDKEKYLDVTSSEAFQYLYDHDYVCSPGDSEVLNNTSEAYQRVNVENVNVKGVSMLKLYVPAVAKDEDKIRYFIYNALHPVLLMLFGSDVVSMKSKEGIEYEDFQDGKERVLLVNGYEKWYFPVHRDVPLFILLGFVPASFFL